MAKLSKPKLNKIQQANLHEYNKQIGFVLGMIILPFIFVPLLVFKNDNPVIVDYFEEEIKNDEDIIEEIEDENSL